MNRGKIFYIFAALAILFLQTAPLALAVEGVPLAPQCNPDEFPGDSEAGNPCDAAQFATLLRNIIKWCAYIIFPIATFFIAWGGFMILMSGGSTERVAEGKKKIKIAVTGIVIAGLALLVISLVFKALEVQEIN